MGNRLRINLKVRRPSMHAKLLVEVAHGRVIVTVLLLTPLGVRAPHVPRTCHRRLRQRKPWHVRSCSSTSLPLRRGWRSGDLLFRASSASSTKMGRSRQGPRGGAPSIRRELMGRRLEAVRPRYTLLHGSNGARRPGGMMSVMMIPRHRPIRGCAAISAKFSKNEVGRTLELPSSGDGRHAINLIGV
jgi:hypothetical protein